MVTAQLVKELRDATNLGILDCKKALEATNGNIDAAIDWLREKGIAKAAKKESRIAAEGLANIYVSGNKAVILEVNSETDFVAQNEDFKKMVDEIGNAVLNSDATTVEEANALEINGTTVSDYVVAMTAKIGEKLSLRRLEVVTKSDDATFGSYLHMGGKIAALTVVKGDNSEVAKDVAMQAAAMRPLYTTIDSVPEEDLEHEKAVIKEQVINEGKKPEFAEKIVEGRINKFYEENVLEEQAFIKDSGLKIKDYLSNNGSKLVSLTRYEVGEGMEKRNDNFAEEVMSQIK